MMLQQTLWMNLNDLSDFLVVNEVTEELKKEAGYTPEENFKTTNFDEIILDFEESISESYQIVSKGYYVSSNKLICIIMYVSKKFVNQKIQTAELSGLSLAPK